MFLILIIFSPVTFTDSYPHPYQSKFMLYFKNVFIFHCMNTCISVFVRMPKEVKGIGSPGAIDGYDKSNVCVMYSVNH